MYPQDETTFGQNQNSAQAAVAAMPAEESINKKNAARWQTVAIGGVTGIAMGAAAFRAFETLASDEEAVELVEGGETDGAATAEAAGATVTEVHQATVDQNLSFGEAFAAARAEVGAGGVFIWHGQLYNTFTAEEWQGMSDAQRDEFATDVQPYLGQQTAEVHQPQTTTQTTTTQTTTMTDGTGQDGNVHPVTTEEAATEPEVHFLGVEAREVEGQTMNVGHMTVNDVQVALVDMDNDEIFDISLTDANRNDEIEENEVADISAQGLDVETFQTLSEIEQMQQQGQLEQANHVQEDLAPDMPDYMNDADVDLA